MSAPYILYGGGITRAMGVQMVLEELRLPYQLKAVDIRKGEHREAAFLAVNPAGYVPALVTPEGETLHETAALMLWLADKHGATELAPATDDPLRGQFLKWLFYFTNDIQPPSKTVFYPDRYTTASNSADEILKLANAQALERWAVVEKHLADHGPYHLGERFSLLDLHVAMWAAYGLQSVDEILTAMPAVRRCYDLVAKRPLSGPLLNEFQREIKATTTRPLQAS
jgi:glutathione S-transferase